MIIYAFRCFMSSSESPLYFNLPSFHESWYEFKSVFHSPHKPNKIYENCLVLKGCFPVYIGFLDRFWMADVGSEPLLMCDQWLPTIKKVPSEVSSRHTACHFWDYVIKHYGSHLEVILSLYIAITHSYPIISILKARMMLLKTMWVS